MTNNYVIGQERENTAGCVHREGWWAQSIYFIVWSEKPLWAGNIEHRAHAWSEEGSQEEIWAQYRGDAETGSANALRPDVLGVFDEGQGSWRIRSGGSKRAR